ncbi:hypothetical protein CBG46_00155 [Actinobacillus succinogenes]|nr:hypothetical protein CBG46_00155 [Actinobacillus succinogenes]
MLGGHFIGNNKNATQVKGLSFSKAHSDANQNINNLKFVDDKETIKYKLNILNKTHNNGVRQYNVVGEGQ